jgi:hypothetical protein
VAESEQERVHRIYKRRRWRQWMLMVPLVVGIMVGYHGKGSLPWLPVGGLSPGMCLAVGAGLIVAVALITLMNWRCPSCGGFLGKQLSPLACRCCGVRLRQEDLGDLSPRLSPAQRWGLAAGGVLSRLNRDNVNRLLSSMDDRELREALEEGWSVRDAVSFRNQASWLTAAGHSAVFDRARGRSRDQGRDGAVEGDGEGKGRRRGTSRLQRIRAQSLIGFDMGRLVCLARWSYTVGYIDQDEAWHWIMRAARRIQETFSSWTELSDNFCKGWKFWSHEQEVPDELLEACRWLDCAWRSPLRKLEWNVDLAGGTAAPRRRIASGPGTGNREGT